MEQEATYEQIDEAAQYLLSKVTGKPTVGIICGACLGSITDAISPKIEIPFEEIPNFPCSCKAGHPGFVVIGTLNGGPVVCVKGRCHFYEGVSMAKCTMAVRVLKLVGITQIILINDAGGVNEAYAVGDIMLIKDHINIMGLCGNNPLIGENDERWGPRIVAMTNAYDKDLLKKAKEKFKENKLDGQIYEGVFACVSGPNYETLAETRMLRMVGVDAVGMSIVPEAVVAKHCGMKVLALSLITNLAAADITGFEVQHEDVVAVSTFKVDTVSTLIQKVVGDIAGGGVPTACQCGK